MNNSSKIFSVSCIFALMQIMQTSYTENRMKVGKVNVQLEKEHTVKEQIMTPEPNIGISKESRVAVAELLNQLLADEFALYVKTLNYHWNVTGPFFGPLHKLFQDQYEQLAHFVDEIAERVRIIGLPALGSLKEFNDATQLNEGKGELLADQIMIANLLHDHELIIREIRTDIEACISPNKDEGTANFLTDLLEKHEKIAWFLRSHINK